MTFKTPSLLKSRDFLNAQDLQSTVNSSFQKFEAPDSFNQKFGVSLVRRTPELNHLKSNFNQENLRNSEHQKLDYIEILRTAMLNEIIQNKTFEEEIDNNSSLKKVKQTSFETEKEKKYIMQIEMLKKINNDMVNMCLELEK